MEEEEEGNVEGVSGTEAVQRERRKGGEVRMPDCSGDLKSRRDPSVKFLPLGAEVETGLVTCRSCQRLISLCLDRAVSTRPALCDNDPHARVSSVTCALAVQAHSCVFTPT